MGPPPLGRTDRGRTYKVDVSLGMEIRAGKRAGERGSYLMQSFAIGFWAMAFFQASRA